MEPKIPEGCVKTLKLKLAAKDGINMFFGVTKEPFEKSDIGYCIGEKPLDWAFSPNDGRIRKGGQSSLKYANEVKTGEIIECVIDRVNGTMSFTVNGIDKGIAFTDKEFKTGDMYFAVGLLNKDYAFEIVD